MIGCSVSTLHFRAMFHGEALGSTSVKAGEPGDVLLIPKAATDLNQCPLRVLLRRDAAGSLWLMNFGGSLK